MSELHDRVVGLLARARGSRLVAAYDGTVALDEETEKLIRDLAAVADAAEEHLDSHWTDVGSRFDRTRDALRAALDPSWATDRTKAGQE